MTKAAVWAETLFFAPLRQLSRRARAVLVVLGTALIVLHSTWLQQRESNPFGLPDVSYYLNIARGHLELVAQPFSSRMLAPLLARGIAHAGHWPLEQGFTILGYLCLTVTIGIVLWLAMDTAAPRMVLLALGAVPFWGQSLHGLGLPDLLYAALLGCLLLALQSGRVLLAAGLLLPLMVTRESTSLTLFCLLVVAWRRLRPRGVALALAAVAVGAGVVHVLSRGNKGNPEHLPQSLYMLGKVPWNLIRTSGIQPWSNLYPNLCPTPVWQHPFHLGRITEVGYCYWTPLPLWQALDAFVTTFGLLPVAAFVLWRWSARSESRNLLQRFSLLYGGISFLLAPALGTWYTRLFGYGWPLGLVAAPLLLGEAYERAGTGRQRRSAAAIGCILLGLHVWICAIGYRFHQSPQTVLALGLEVLGFALLWPGRRGRSERSDAAGVHGGRVVKSE